MSDFADAITASFNRVIEFDNQIASDKQKFSHWILGLATAGFALALTQADKLLAHSWASPEPGNIALKLSAATFVVSAIVGAVVVRCVDLQVDLNRQSMTLMLRQQLLLSQASMPAHENDSPEQVIAKVAGGEYLDAGKQKVFEETRVRQSPRARGRSVCSSLSRFWRPSATHPYLPSRLGRQ